MGCLTRPQRLLSDARQHVRRQSMIGGRIGQPEADTLERTRWGAELSPQVAQRNPLAHFLDSPRTALRCQRFFRTNRPPASDSLAHPRSRTHRVRTHLERSARSVGPKSGLRRTRPAGLSPAPEPRLAPADWIRAATRPTRRGIVPSSIFNRRSFWWATKC